MSLPLTPLHVAAKNGHRQIVDDLIAIGIPLDIQAASGETALHMAAMNGHTSVVQALLSGGADASIPDSSGALPTDYAEFRGFDGLAAMLKPHSVPASATPATLFEAIEERDVALAERLLLAFSPNVNAGGTYPLHYALTQRQTEFVPLLLSAGADPNLRTRKGSQALAIAVCKGLDAAVRTLLKASADVNDRNPTSGLTPLHHAIAKERAVCVQMLMNAGANPLAADRQGRTPLDMALRTSGREMIAAMIGAGLLKKVKADALLAYGIQARRFGLAFTVALMGRTGWHALDEMRGMANPGQLRLITEREPGQALGILRDSIEKNGAQSGWAVLDAL